MKKKFAALLLPVMLMASLTSCNANEKQYDEFCAKAADAVALLINSTTGKEMYASEKTRYLENYNSVLALNTFMFQEKELEATWELSPADKWVSAPYVLDTTRNKLAPIYGKEAYDTEVKCTVTCLDGGKKHGKAELSWKFHVEATNTIELSLKQISDKFIENEYKPGDMAGKDENGEDITVATRGYITGTFNQKKAADLGSGVFIQDDVYGMQLFSTKVLNDLYKEAGVKVGDCVFVVGKLSLYQGYLEMEPSLLELIDGPTYNIKPAVTIDLADKTFDKTLKANCSSLVSFAGLSYKSGNVSAATSHADITFTFNDKDVGIRCNYHLGEDVMNAIKDLVATFVTSASTDPQGPTVVTVKGILSFYNDTPQIIPIFGTESFINPTPVKAVEPAPEA